MPHSHIDYVYLNIIEHLPDLAMSIVNQIFLSLWIYIYIKAKGLDYLFICSKKYSYCNFNSTTMLNQGLSQDFLSVCLK